MSSTGSQTLQILHVDDNPRLGELVQTVLHREQSGLDCTVATETAPRAALDRMRGGDHPFDCVISDYDMPEMNGIELLDAIRDHHPELPVLLFSGEESTDVAAEIIGAGVTDYLKKGGGMDTYTMLIRRVEHAVDSEGRFDPESATQLDGVGVVGADEHFETADETYAAAYGYESTEVAGKHWTELHPEEEVEHIRTHVLPVVENGGKWTGRSEGLRADGSTFTESKMVSALDDGRILITVSEVEDG
jgi:PAS domain S-box-containing protein